MLSQFMSHTLSGDDCFFLSSPPSWLLLICIGVSVIVLIESVKEIKTALIKNRNISFHLSFHRFKLRSSCDVQG